jgi:xylulokinase
MLPAFVILDSSNGLIRPSIQQMDSRTFEEVKLIEEKIGKEIFFNITGCTVNIQMIAPKIIWMRKNEPENFKKIKTVCGSYDYINYRLTGVKSVESNWALESGMYDIKLRKWSKKILDMLEIDEEILPKVNWPTDIIGVVNKEASKLLGIKSGTPVIAGFADHISSAFISGICNYGDIAIKLGSAGDIIFTANKLVTDKRLYIDFHPKKDNYYLSGCMATSGTLLKWFKNYFFDDKKIDFKDLDKYAEKIESGSNGLLVLPYFIGEKTPIFDPLARGVIFGLTTFHNRYHIYRAILESIGYAFLHHLEIIHEIGFKTKRIIASGAGASSIIWIQILSNIFGMEINLLKQNPGSVMGAIFLAGIATNLFKNWDETAKFSEISNTIYPIEKENLKYSKYFLIYKKLG